ncbi:MAG TPA: hypothetical protein VN361_10075, partial [Oxalicibacterium sp.]|nr:hypothetical protein [Oxalicibacterium sp.]
RMVPDHWPVAALTRSLDAGDAALSSWLRADPAYIAPDINGARLLAYGEAMALTEEDARQLLPALQPLFGDYGCPIDAPHPSRWYLRLPKDARLPEFAEPEAALGDDLSDHLPEGDAGRRWRALLTEAQVILHQHPWNARRAAQGNPAINSLWFWGAGTMPGSVRTSHRQIKSHDPLLQALAKAAGVESRDEDAVDALVDLRHLRSPQAFVDEVLPPLLDEIRDRRLETLDLDFEDGALYALRRDQHWRVWRRPLPVLAA